jgi:O-succinylhomoserine sulfhydrylase
MTSNNPEKRWKPATQMVRGGVLRSSFGETTEGLFLTSGFVYDSAETAESRFNGEAPGYVYSRYLNPTLDMLERRLALLEGAEKACVMASGMAAVFGSMLCFLRAGDHVVASKVLFSSCFYILNELLPRWGIEVTFVPGTKPSDWETAFRPTTKAVFVESPANPTLDILDLPMICEVAHHHNARVIVDNVFASPLLQHPLQMGADIVVYSTTKHLDGQGKTLGGAVLGSESYIMEELLPFHRHTGPALSPFNAWLILKSLETFEMRMHRHCDNAEKVVAFLHAHPRVENLRYPGHASHPQHALAMQQMSRGGGMVGFDVKGGKEAAFAMLNKLQLIDISNNLGDAKSLITHPATTTHASLGAENRAAFGISDGMLRLSVGLEDAEDLIADLGQALS